MFFITLYRLVNDLDFVKYAGLQVSGCLLAWVASYTQINQFLSLGVKAASIISLLAGVILVFYKVKKIQEDLKSK